jgi:hypothetical protein
LPGDAGGSDDRYTEKESTKAGVGVMKNMLTASLIALTLSIPLMMASWFSPLLVNSIMFRRLLPCKKLLLA